MPPTRGFHLSVDVVAWVVDVDVEVAVVSLAGSGAVLEEAVLGVLPIVVRIRSREGCGVRSALAPYEFLGLVFHCTIADQEPVRRAEVHADAPQLLTAFLIANHSATNTPSENRGPTTIAAAAAAWKAR